MVEEQGSGIDIAMKRQALKISDESVRRLLESGGWPYDRIASDTWRSHFRGRSVSCPFLLRLDPDGYVIFAIVPFLRTPAAPENAARLYERLLVLNQSMLMAKFSIDDDLDVVLSVEYPVAELDESEFADALDVLAYYADRHYDELLRLST